MIRSKIYLQRNKRALRRRAPSQGVGNQNVEDLRCLYYTAADVNLQAEKEEL